ncbi:MAG: hypothetical protein RPU90_12140 [Candidatus Sedimenticola sp. (ex Thyasira tokunagai)]
MKVTFYKSAQNYKGDVYKSPLGSFEFNGKITEAEAVLKAQKMFEEKMNVSDWLQVAEFYEVK